MRSIRRNTTLAAAFALAAIATAPSSAQDRRGTHDPILFVHGWSGDVAQWQWMIARFRRDGWTDRELFAWDFSGRASNRGYAEAVGARVDQILAATGAERVVIVTHSMGSLSTRYYLKHLGGAEKVSAWVSLGGPNHGTNVAELCVFGACREMRRGSPFLVELNRGDETPGETRYATWRSPCDEMIDPVETVPVLGGENRVTSCLLHLDLLRNVEVYEQVRDFISRSTAVRISEASRR
jgi:triacylglycerol lipase